MGALHYFLDASTAPVMSGPPPSDGPGCVADSDGAGVDVDVDADVDELSRALPSDLLLSPTSPRHDGGRAAAGCQWGRGAERGRAEGETRGWDLAWEQIAASAVIDRVAGEGENYAAATHGGSGSVSSSLGSSSGSDAGALFGGRERASWSPEGAPTHTAGALARLQRTGSNGAPRREEGKDAVRAARGPAGAALHRLSSLPSAEAMAAAAVASASQQEPTSASRPQPRPPPTPPRLHKRRAPAPRAKLDRSQSLNLAAAAAAQRAAAAEASLPQQNHPQLHQPPGPNNTTGRGLVPLGSLRGSPPSLARSQSLGSSAPHVETSPLRPRAPVHPIGRQDDRGALPGNAGESRLALACARPPTHPRHPRRPLARALSMDWESVTPVARCEPAEGRPTRASPWPALGDRVPPRRGGGTSAHAEGGGTHHDSGMPENSGAMSAVRARPRASAGGLQRAMSLPVSSGSPLPTTRVLSDHAELQAQQSREAQQQAQLYKTELCRSFETFGACRYGRKCRFAHGASELREVIRHPKYKTVRCRTWALTGTCKYGHKCLFLHDEDVALSDDLIDPKSALAGRVGRAGSGLRRAESMPVNYTHRDGAAATRRTSVSNSDALLL